MEQTTLLLSSSTRSFVRT